MMENIVNYVKTLLALGFGRKRRAVDECEPPLKVRRISSSQMSSPEASSGGIKKRNSLLPKPDKPRWSFKDISPIVLDDEDDVVEVKKPAFDLLRRTSSFKQTTSTPNCSGSRIQNGTADDDVIFVKSSASPSTKKALAKRKGFDYIKPATLGSDLKNGHGKVNAVQNGATKRKDVSPLFSTVQDIKAKIMPPAARKPIHSVGLDHTIRLDEKKRYEEMLERSAMMKTPLQTYSDFKKFQVRGKQLVDLALKSTKRTPEFIDLTNDVKPKRKSTLELIQQVLKDHDDVVFLKDSDSDVEVLPTPPSPKSDFEIEKCNSLATFKHPSDPTHNDWMRNEIKKHDEAIQKRQRLIDEQKVSLNKFSRISGEIREQLLHHKLNECLSIKDALLPLEEPSEDPFKELTAHQNALVDNAFSRQRSATEVLISKFNMNITRADIGTLYGLSWLNDEVINFYMNMIIERGKSSRFPAAYAMNTFFYPKVSSGGQSSVRRWTRKVDIFSYDIIAVPIHLGMHWCMVIVDFRKKTITYYDSMGSPNKTCLTTLLQYLRDEHNDKKKTDIDLSDWRLINARDIPQQMNGSDCGMFSITFAEFLTRDAKITFGQEHMPYLRRKVTAEILEGKLFISQ